MTQEQSGAVHIYCNNNIEPQLYINGTLKTTSKKAITHTPTQSTNLCLQLTMHVYIHNSNNAYTSTGLIDPTPCCDSTHTHMRISGFRHNCTMPEAVR